MDVADIQNLGNQAGFGRLKPPDRDRDFEYELPRRREAAARIDWRHWNSPGVLDQGYTPHCVAFSGVKFLTTGPIRNRPIDTFELYRACQRVDEWPGENYDGTSVRALFKIFKERGYIGEYRWAFDAETVANHVLTVGPVVMGTLWDSEMSNPFFVETSDDYYIIPGRNIANEWGGHAWTIIGVNRLRINPDGTRGACRMINSWGDGWADQGRAWITFGDLDKLIKLDGEACTANEIKLPLAA